MPPPDINSEGGTAPVALAGYIACSTGGRVWESCFSITARTSRRPAGWPRSVTFSIRVRRFVAEQCLGRFVPSAAYTAFSAVFAVAGRRLCSQRQSSPYGHYRWQHIPSPRSKHDGNGTGRNSRPFARRSSPTSSGPSTTCSTRSEEQTSVLQSRGHLV